MARRMPVATHVAVHERSANRARDAVRSLRAGGRWLTAHDRPLPDFLIIGAQRCGTTSLYKNLVRHPDIVEPICKERQFFTVSHTLGERWYRSHFPRLERGQQTFEATPYYFFHPDAPARVQTMLPDAKIIVLLRDPVARAYSHYLHIRNLGIENLSFEEALDAEPWRLNAAERKGLHSRAGRYLHSHFSYVARGMYASQLERWLTYLPATRLKAVKSETFYHNPQEVHAEVLEFLGLPTFALKRFTKANVLADGEAPKLASSTQVRLRKTFAADTERVRAMLGWQRAWE
jgi:hypothetical protein